MRPIKFRALNIETKQWVYFALAGKKGNLSMQLVQLANDLWAQPEDIRTVYTALTEFTGLKDKNDVEVYEGDIVDAYAHVAKGQVIFNPSKGFGIQDLDNEFVPFAEIYYIHDIEVISNIYEDAKLLIQEPSHADK